MPGTVKSELLPDADRLHKCDGQEKVCEIQHLPLDKSHFITAYRHVQEILPDSGIPSLNYTVKILKKKM